MAASDLALRLLITARDGASGVLGGLIGRVAQLGAAIAAWFTIGGIADSFRSAVGGAADLQQQLTVLNQVASTTPVQLARLKAAAEAAANSPLPYTASEAAAGLIELGKAGQTTEQMLASLSPTLSMAAAGQISVAESAGIMNAAMAAFKLPAEEAARVANTLVAGANASQTSVSGLSQALSYAGPIALAAGYSLEQVVAMVGKMADGGIDASRAGTSLNSVLSQLQDPASSASTALSAMGITTRDLGKVLSLLASGSPMAERAINAFGMEAGPGLRTLIASGMSGVEGLRAKLEGATTAADDAAAAMQKNLKGAFGDLGSTWDAIKGKIGEGFLPALEREIRALSAQLRGWIDSGQLEQVRAGLVDAFEAAAAAVKTFIAEFDLRGMIAGIVEWGKTSGTVFGQWRAGLAEVGDVARRFKAEVDIVWGAVMTVILKVGQTYNGLAANIAFAYSRMLDLGAKLRLNDQQTADQARATAEAYKQAYIDGGRGVDEAIQGTGAAWDRLFAGQQTAAPAAAQTVTAAADAQTQALGLTADQLDAFGTGLTSFDAKTQIFKASAAAVTAATQQEAAATADLTRALEVGGRAILVWDAATKQWAPAMNEAAVAQAKLTDAERSATSNVAVALAAAQAKTTAVSQSAAATQSETNETTKNTAAIAAQTVAKAAAARKAAEDAEKRKLAIEEQKRELTILAQATTLVEAEGQARGARLQNLQAEAQARGNMTAVERIGNQITAETIAGAKEVQAAKQREADVATALATALRDDVKANQELSPAILAAVTAAEQSAQAKQLEAQAAQENVRHQEAMATAARAAAAAEDTLRQAFLDVGYQGVQSMSDVRSAIQAATNSGELEALGAALKDAFAQGALGAAEYQAALESIKQKQDDIKAQASGKGKSYTYLLDPATMDAQFNGDRQQIARYVEMWTAGVNQKASDVGAVLKTYDDWVAAQIEQKKAEYLKSKADAQTQAAQQAQWDAAAGYTTPASGTGTTPTASGLSTTSNITLQIAGILDVNDPVTLGKLATRLQPVLTNLARMGA